jgi:hypothetical protein
MIPGCVLTRLVLVFALNLQDIKEVGRRGVDLDEVLVKGRLGVRELRHPELVGSLETSVDIKSMRHTDFDD